VRSVSAGPANTMQLALHPSVLRPSPFSRIDDGVKRAVERSTYSPAIFRRNAVGGEYNFVGVYVQAPE
jgi:hypothetical protein